MQETGSLHEMVPCTRYHPAVEVTFESERLARICNSEDGLVRSYGPEGAKCIARRLTQLWAAACLEDLRNAPGRCHELVDDRDGCLSVDLHGPARLVFRPAYDEHAGRQNGALSWASVTEVIVVDISDTDPDR